ncbi:MAG: phosphate-starvation-inducible PsiE family protein [Gammaproteobacteria bacterium]|nr:phosphate-starvation-inducible PsiE family protein [Gammaproteobacteria bacterium]
MLVFKRPVTVLLRWTSDLAHLVISLALVAATVIITVFFFHEVYIAIQVHSLIKGFLHALGILLLLWTMVELINTEIRYLQGERIDIAIFIEVALVVVVREIIMLPVQETPVEWIEIGMWTGAAALLGVTYVLVRLGQRWLVTEPAKALQK